MTDPYLWTDLARYAHILAVAIGIGVAFLADYHVLSTLRRPVDGPLIGALDLYHSIIVKMVLAMWITGLVMVGIRTGFDPANLTPKLIGKLVAVAILTVNSAIIGRVAMPLIMASHGRSLLWLPLRSKMRLAALGAISSVSWMLALALGTSKSLAASGWVVFAVGMPVAYVLGVAVAVGATRLMHAGGLSMTHGATAARRGLYRAERRVTAPVPVPAPIPQNRRVGSAIAAE